MNTDTPMFRQYLALKAEEPDALLFYRMGDFYELFFDDARVAAEQLELTLTSRDKGREDPIPMAGVPHHAARGYIQTLVERGYKVAVADQVEDPKLAKGLVKRAIVRVVSPGVGMDPEDLAPRESCWLVSVVELEGRWGLALLDVSTGDLRVTEPADRAVVVEELVRSTPREAVLPEGLELDGLAGVTANRVPLHAFDVTSGRAALCARLQVRDLSGFGCEDFGPGLAAAAVLVDYASTNLRGELPHLTRIRPYSVGGFMVLDAATRRNLELFKPISGTARKGTLIHLLDRTATAMGGRLLREWLAYPLMDLATIRLRQDRVEALVEERSARRRLQELLREVADLERLAAKLAQQTANAKDLVRLRASLEALPQLRSLAEGLGPLAGLLSEDLCADVAARIAATLIDDPPIAIGEGGLIREGVDSDLDELVALSRDGKGVIASMETREREATDISSLKVRYNKVFGYFIEVTKANIHRVPDHYIRKQTLANGERYITPELKELEEKVLGADERRRALELALFTALREELAGAVPRVQALAGGVAALDVVGALAAVASDLRYVRPVVDGSTELHIESGRHPVVEQQVVDEAFVPNDLDLGSEGRRLLIVTGPNMSGKSTVMRQAALVAILAQIGSFVPAESARVGLCDRVFTRVGASDDLATGRSTFMVEMSETANILHHATERSLVILDEIGRGTSTYDGLAIAWAVAEELHDRLRARTLFATHYHELCELADSRAGVANVSIAVSQFGERIIFLRRLKEGGSSRSYGIQCARLAGMPRHVVGRAKHLLTRLEKHAAANPSPQLTLFGARPAASEPEPSARDELREALKDYDPDTLSPRQALDALYRLRDLARDPG